jgi:uncharacterized protein (TIGR03067 family)
MQSPSAARTFGAVPCLALLLCIGCTRNPPAPQPANVASAPSGQPPRASEGLEGTWKKVAEEYDGQQVPQPPVTVLMEIAGNKVTFTTGNRVVGDGTIKVDTSRQPRTIDLQVTSRVGGTAGRETDSYGIYEVSGDTLKICTVGNAEQRPKTIPPPAGSGATTTTYQRSP